MDIHLKVVEGRPLGASIPLSQPEFLIGRDSACQLRPKHESVGRRHCSLSLGEAGLAIRDLGSPSGTLLNGRRLDPSRPASARHGDRLRVGNLVFEVAIGGRSLASEDDEVEADSPAAIAERMLLGSALGAAPLGRELGSRLAATTVEGIPVVTVEMTKIIDELSLMALRRGLRQLAARTSPEKLVLDFRRVRALSIEAAEAVLAFLRRVELRGGVVKLCGVDENVQDSLDEVGVTSIADLHLDVHEAVWSHW